MESRIAASVILCVLSVAVAILAQDPISVNEVCLDVVGMYQTVNGGGGEGGEEPI